MFGEPTWRRVGLLAVVGLLLASAGTTAALAQDDGGDDDTVQIASQDVAVSDAVVRIGDAHLRGPGLPDERIDERRYTLRDATVHVKGLNVQWDGTTYTFCRITVTFDDVGVTIHDVTLDDGA